MPLTDEEQATLDALTRKRDEPEPKPEGNGIGRVLNVSLDLGDDAQVEKAFKLGLLERVAGDDDDSDDDDSDDDADDAPRRRGFFPEK